ncbi:MAG: hypothetical protein HY901_25035 [Deltaproteobacteria bacterium]|nr:hypothetical protein [Deltaproteobacteria bacterium]
MKTFKVALLGLAAVALASCGGSSVSSKEDAAQVMQRMTSMGAQSNQLQQGLGSALVNTVSLNGESGSATASVTSNVTTTGTSVQRDVDVDLTFNQFSPDGDNTYDGTEEMTWSVVIAAGEQAANVSTVSTLKANMTISGEYNATVVADVTIKMNVSAMAASGGSVTMVIDGTFVADGKTYTFDDETFQVTASR